MLHKNHISQIQIYSEEWHQFRRGKMTSSRINTIMAPKGIGDGGLSYIMHKVGETLTGHTTDEGDEIEDENTVWGIQYEPEAIKHFCDDLKIQYLVSQKLISAPDSHFSSTPDAIWVKGICENQEEYNVSTLEVKCPRKYARFIPLFRCNTPQDVKDYSRVYYWQVLDQMDNCGSAVGYFGVYHPLFPPHSNRKIIEFKKMDLWDDFKLLKERKLQAVQLFEEMRAEFVLK